MVKLALELLVDSCGQLDPLYCKSELSHEEYVSILQKHLSRAWNAGLAGPLSGWAQQAGEPTYRLLRLTCRYTT